MSILKRICSPLFQIAHHARIYGSSRNCTPYFVYVLNMHATTVASIRQPLHSWPRLSTACVSNRCSLRNRYRFHALIGYSEKSNRWIFRAHFCRNFLTHFLVRLLIAGLRPPALPAFSPRSGRPAENTSSPTQYRGFSRKRLLNVPVVTRSRHFRQRTGLAINGEWKIMQHISGLIPAMHAYTYASVKRSSNPDTRSFAANMKGAQRFMGFRCVHR